jgi:hypothetical protein
MNESDILKKVMLKLGTKEWLRIWRHNTGQAWNGKRIQLKKGSYVTDNFGRAIIVETGDILIKNAHPVNFGLKGSGDIAGIIAPHGKLLYIETKYGRYRQTPQQKRFAEMIRRMGGIYIVVRNPDEAEQQIIEALRSK